MLRLRIEAARGTSDASFADEMFQWPDPKRTLQNWNNAADRLEAAIDAAFAGAPGIVVAVVENFDILLATLFKDDEDEQRLRAWLDPHRAHLPEFPFGTDFDATERMLLPVLQRLGREAVSLRGKARLLAASWRLPPHPREREAMTRMGFDTVRSLDALALRGALRREAAQAAT